MLDFYNRCFDWAAMTLGNFDLAEVFAVYMVAHYLNVKPCPSHLTEAGIIFTHEYWHLV